MDGFALPRPAHHQVELTWVERGSGLRLVGDDASAFEAGDLVLRGPDLPHTWLTSGKRQSPRPAATVLQFAPEWLSGSKSPELVRIVGTLFQAPARDRQPIASVAVPAAFSRIIRREVGKTFTTYVNDLRCAEAQLQWRRSQRPVADIAATCGFATLSLFNREFRRRCGVAPRDWRAAG